MSDPHPVPTLGGKPIVSSVQRNKVAAPSLAGTAALPELHGFVGMLKQQQKKVGGIIKRITNAVKSMAATQASPGDNIDEGGSPEPPAKKAKQPAKPAARVPARQTAMAVSAAATRDEQLLSRGGPGRNRM
eukprot:jgi/Tetstr1/428140/TSEL_018192.t1